MPFSIRPFRRFRVQYAVTYKAGTFIKLPWPTFLVLGHDPSPFMLFEGRLNWFASAYFGNDRFQDLKIRTALATGPGYQFIERGDFSGILKDMTLYAEAGLAYFNEDFRVADDASSLRGRWSLKLNRPVLDDRVTFYHFDELYPSLQNTKNYYLTMDNGVRFKLFEGFVSNFQVTTRFNSNSARGTDS